MLVRLGAPLLAVLIALGVVPAASAMSPEWERPLRSFTFSSDCTDLPGRLRVRETRPGPEEFAVAVRGTGLPSTLDHGQVYWWKSARQRPVETFEPDPSEGRVSHRVSFRGTLTGGRVEAEVMDTDRQKRCVVGGNVRPRFVSIGTSSSVAFDVTLRKGRREVTVNVNDVACRGSQTVRARAVIKLADRTVRATFEPARCHGEPLSISHRIVAVELPRAVRVVTRSGDRVGHAAYDLRQVSDSSRDAL